MKRIMITLLALLATIAISTSNALAVETDACNLLVERGLTGCELACRCAIQECEPALPSLRPPTEDEWAHRLGVIDSCRAQCPEHCDRDSDIERFNCVTDHLDASDPHFLGCRMSDGGVDLPHLRGRGIVTEPGTLSETPRIDSDGGKDLPDFSSDGDATTEDPEDTCPPPPATPEAWHRVIESYEGVDCRAACDLHLTSDCCSMPAYQGLFVGVESTPQSACETICRANCAGLSGNELRSCLIHRGNLESHCPVPGPDRPRREIPLPEGDDAVVEEEADNTAGETGEPVADGACSGWVVESGSVACCLVIFGDVSGDVSQVCAGDPCALFYREFGTLPAECRPDLCSTYPEATECRPPVVAPNEIPPAHEEIVPNDVAPNNVPTDFFHAQGGGCSLMTDTNADPSNRFNWAGVLLTAVLLTLFVKRSESHIRQHHNRMLMKKNKGGSMKNFRISIAVLVLTGAFAFTTGCEYYKGEEGPILTPSAQDETIINLEKRITELQGELANPPADASDEQIRALQAQIAEIQRAIEELGSVETAAPSEPSIDAEALDALNEQIRTLQEQIAALEGEIEALNNAETPDPGSTEPPSDEVASGTILADVPYASLPPPDFKAPEVTEVKATTISVVFKFSESIDPDGIEASCLRIRRRPLLGERSILVSNGLATRDTALFFFPASEPLLEGKTYKVVLDRSCVKDLRGNQMADDYTKKISISSSDGILDAINRNNEAIEESQRKLYPNSDSSDGILDAINRNNEAIQESQRKLYPNSDSSDGILDAINRNNEAIQESYRKLSNSD